MAQREAETPISAAAGHHGRSLNGPLAAARRNKEVHDTGAQESQHRECRVSGDGHKCISDDLRQRHALIVCTHHHAHDTGIEGELQDNARRAGGGISDGIDITAQAAMTRIPRNMKIMLTIFGVRADNTLLPLATVL